MQPSLFDLNGAIFSNCAKYRYKLWRIWELRKPYAMFLMLNHSTADEFNNDPTVARCQSYASDWGYGGLHVCNLFTYRATDRSEMKATRYPIGKDNDQVILDVSLGAGIVICAWGNDGNHKNRSTEVVKLLNRANVKLHCLRITKENEPEHPLYLKKSLRPIPYPP